MRDVHLVQTERTLLQLRRSAGLYRSLMRSGELIAEDTTTLTMGSWMTLLGYTEFYVDEMLDVLFDGSLAKSSAGETYLLKNALVKSHANWESRREALDGIFGVRVTQFGCWQRLNAAIWVRNSIAHGAGGLTRLQKPEEAVKASQVGVEVVEGRLRLGGESVDCCSVACCDFVNEMDAATRIALASAS